MIEQSVLPRHVPPRPSPHLRDEQADNNFYFVGNPQQPSTLKALRYEKSIRALENQIVIIWVCANEDELQCRDEIQGYRNQNINVPRINVINIAEFRNIKNTFPPQKFIEIWFSKPQIYQEIKATKLEGYRVEYIYFNSKIQTAKIQFKQKRRNQQWMDVSYGTHCIIELINTYFQRMALPNFRCLGQYDQIQDLQKLTLMAIINDQSETCFDLERFLRLVIQNWGSIYSKDQIISFRQQFSEKNILALYTKQSFFYRFLNTFMRASKDPMELFYMQTFIKGLFTKVKQLYKQQKEKIQEGQQFFYRGALFQQQEIEQLRKNQGKIVRSFGFMSTSKNRRVAETFARNGLIIIRVDSVKRAEETDNGFAQISKFSDHQNEEEWLFNPLNQFRIDKVELVSEKWEIHLIYGEVAEVRAKGSQILSPQQKKINSLSVYDRQLGSVRSQAEIFRKCNYYKTAILYNKKKLEKIQGEASLAQVMKVKRQLIEVYIKKSEYRLALQQIKSMKSSQDSLQKYEGDAYFGLQQYANAEECYLKVIKDIKKLEHLGEPFFINLQSNFDSRLLQTQKDFSFINTLLCLSLTCLKLNKLTEARNYSRIAIAKWSTICDTRDQAYTVQLLKHCLEFENVSESVKCAVKKFLQKIGGGEDKSAPAYIGCLVLVALLFVENKQNQEVKSGDAYNLISESESLYSETKQFFTPNQNANFYYFKALFFYSIQKYSFALEALGQALQFYEKDAAIEQEALAHALLGRIKSKQAETMEEGAVALKYSLFLERTVMEKNSAPDIINICQCLAVLVSISCLNTDELSQVEELLAYFIDGNAQQMNKHLWLCLDLAKSYVKLKQYPRAKKLVTTFKQNNPCSHQLKLAVVESLLLAADKKYEQAYRLAKSTFNNTVDRTSKEFRDVKQTFEEIKKQYSEYVLEKVFQTLNSSQQVECLAGLQQEDVRSLFEDEQLWQLVMDKKKRQHQYLQSLRDQEIDKEEEEMCKQIFRRSIL